MELNPGILKAVERLGHRVTVGDVAATAGLNINQAQPGLLALASEAGGHLQVADSGEIVYLFPKNFRSILRNKYWQLRLQEWWNQVWKVLFYLIRISFGIVLLLSIVLITVAIVVILLSMNSSGNDNRRSSRGGGMIFIPRFFWFNLDLFTPNYYRRDSRRRLQRRHSPHNEMNFLESIFSFLFGDGNPNADLEEERWQGIGTVIRNHGGAVVAQQIAPYLDSVDDDEDYMLPVLSRFNGFPEVSPEGELIYYFPELQVSAQQQRQQSVQGYLKEKLWRFSEATSNQKMLAIGLGAVNLVGALVLGSLLQDPSFAQSIAFIAFVQSIYGILLAYGIGFLIIPLIRYFWIQGRNGKIEARNQVRQDSAIHLNQANSALQQKIAYARQFATTTVIGEQDITYTTETDLLDQEIQRSEQIDGEWQRRLDSGS